MQNKIEMEKTEIKKGILIGSLITLAALSRLVDHPMNFTPMAAILLFSSAYISNKFLKLILPFGAILFSDVLIEITTGWGFHEGSWSVYLAYLGVFLIGFSLLKKVSVSKVALSSILGSSFFFLFTNFAFFYKEAAEANPSLGQYPHNFSGIISSYQAGLPFFRNMIFGDLMFCAIMFGTFYIVKNFDFNLKKAN